jgi:hypothetical protein
MLARRAHVLRAARQGVSWLCMHSAGSGRSRCPGSAASSQFRDGRICQSGKPRSALFEARLAVGAWPTQLAKGFVCGMSESS